MKLANDRIVRASSLWLADLYLQRRQHPQVLVCAFLFRGLARYCRYSIISVIWKNTRSMAACSNGILSGIASYATVSTICSRYKTAWFATAQKFKRQSINLPEGSEQNIVAMCVRPFAFKKRHTTWSQTQKAKTKPRTAILVLMLALGGNCDGSK